MEIRYIINNWCNNRVFSYFFSSIIYFIWFEILSIGFFIFEFKRNFNKSQQLLEILVQDKTKAMEINKRSKKLWILSSVIYIVITGVMYFFPDKNFQGTFSQRSKW